VLFALGAWWGVERRDGAGDLDTSTERAGVAAARPAASARLDATTARALERALAWLASAQEPDGSWDPARWDPRRGGGRAEYTVGVSGLAVLALSQGEAPEVERAVHRGVEYLVAAQRAAGGWCYPDTDGGDCNVSLSIWPLQCLAAAQRLGWTAFDPAVERGLAWLEGALAEDVGGLPRPVLGVGGHLCGGTGGEMLGAIGLLLCGGERERSAALSGPARRAIDRLVRDVEAPDDTYWAFLVSEALGHRSAPWTKLLRERAQRVLISRQELAGELAGSWAGLDGWSALVGRTGSTALAALALVAPL
jgi:hypothetical protein